MNNIDGVKCIAKNHCIRAGDRTRDSDSNTDSDINTDIDIDKDKHTQISVIDTNLFLVLIAHR